MEAESGIIINPLHAIGTSAAWFRQELDANDVALHKRSALEIALQRLDVYREAALAGHLFTFGTTEEAYAFFGEAVGADFLTKTVHRATQAGLVLDRSRWRCFVGGDPVVTKASQDDSRQRHLTWETIIACAMATFASDVTFDEPDLVCTFQGHRFGVAAKMVHSDRRLWDNVSKGVKQALGRSKAALIFVNVVNLVPVVELMRQCPKQRNAAEIVSWAMSWATSWCERPELHATADEIRKSVPHPIGVAFFFRFYSCSTTNRRHSSTSTRR